MRHRVRYLLHSLQRREVQRGAAGESLPGLVPHPALPLRVERQEHHAPGRRHGRGLVPREIDILAVIDHEVLGRRDAGLGLAAAEHRVEQVVPAVRLAALPHDVQYEPPHSPVEPPRLPVAPRGQEPQPGHLGEQVRPGDRLLQLPDHGEDPLALDVAAPEARPGDHVPGVRPEIVVDGKFQRAGVGPGHPGFPRPHQRPSRVHHQIHHTLGNGRRSELILQSILNQNVMNW